MNIVLDVGVNFDETYRKLMVSLLPLENAPLKLNSLTAKVDGTPCLDEGFVFFTNLPIDVMKYHSLFFENNREAPQWFFILLNKNDHGLTDLRNAARKHNLKNCVFYHAWNYETFNSVIEEILKTGIIIKGKTLFLSKHKKNWISDLATILFKDNQKYVIMDSTNKLDTDSENLLLCGEKINDFKGLTIPEKMEPYFIFRYKNDLQDYIDQGAIITGLSEYYHMTSERVESRFFCVDIESEQWLSENNKSIGNDAVTSGIILWDCFGLPVSRKEYTAEKIGLMAQKNHNTIERLIKLTGQSL